MREPLLANQRTRSLRQSRYWRVFQRRLTLKRSKPRAAHLSLQRAPQDRATNVAGEDDSASCETAPDLPPANKVPSAPPQWHRRNEYLGSQSDNTSFHIVQWRQ